MDDLISRADAISAFCNKECSWGISHNYDCYDDCALRKKFMDIPVVELVRCGNCKKWNRERAKKNHIHFMGYCERLGGYSKREHYCAWAERKKEAQTDMHKVVEPCKDAVSREWMLTELEEMNVANFYELNEHSNEMYGQMKRMIKAAPSVTVEPKQGEWIINNNGWAYCSECESLGLESYNFCPYCGARMKGATDGNK